MRNSQCLGCQTYFQEGYKVPLESMFVEFKNYYLPIKESKQKWILLKTLVGFLNSKGGTIYIGIEDNEGQVVGQEIKRKQRDEFLLFIKTLADKIVPPVDFFNREEISIVYVPVVANKVFNNKYIIKIIVKQGDPSKTYHFSQEIELSFKGTSEKYEIVHAFYRHNMGGIVQIRGEALLEEVARKAATPNEITNTFHKFCNPKPLKLDGPLTKIGFSGIRKEQLRDKLKQMFYNHLQSFDVQYELTYDIENQVLLIGLENEDQFKEINKYVKEHLNELNQGNIFNFLEKGVYLDFYLYKNMGGKRGLSSRQYFSWSSQRSLERRTPLQTLQAEKESEKESIKEHEPIIEEPIQLEKDPNIFNELQFNDNQSEKSPKKEESKQAESKWCRIIEEEERHRDKKQYIEKGSHQESRQKSPDNQFVLTITHLAPLKREQLQVLLKALNTKNYAVTFERYISTLELKFDSRQNVVKYYEILMKNCQKLSPFGVDDNLVIGINMKKIIIRGYNRQKRRELKQYVQNKIKEDCEEVEFKKSNNKYFLEIEFKSRQSTCIWLDKLMKDIKIDEFGNDGTYLNKSGQIRIYIYCECY